MTLKNKFIIFCFLLPILTMAGCTQETTIDSSKVSASPAVKDGTAVPTEVLVENGGTPVDFNNDYFTWSVTSDLFVQEGVNANDNVNLRFQNYDPESVSDGYQLQAGEYFMEITASAAVSESEFRAVYHTVNETIFRGRTALMGADRASGGETVTGGYGYYVAAPSGAIRLDVYAVDQTGEAAAALLFEDLKMGF